MPVIVSYRELQDQLTDRPLVDVQAISNEGAMEGRRGFRLISYELHSGLAELTCRWDGSPALGGL